MTTAQWVIRLKTDCPKCQGYVDLLKYADFWDEHELNIGEHDTERSKGVEVVCPECYNEFEVDLVY